LVIHSLYQCIGEKLPHEPLSDIDKRIINRLRKGSCGFNELCYDLERHVSRNYVREHLKNLVKMGIVKWKKGREGQKHVIELTETQKRFEEKAECLKTMWDDQFSKLKQLEKYVEGGIIAQNEAGSLLVWLIYEAIPLLASGLVESKLPLEARKRLLSFSADKFCSCWEEILRVGEKYSEIRQGFQKGCKELATHTKPIEERIENKFEHLAKLKHKHLSKRS